MPAGSVYWERKKLVFALVERLYESAFVASPQFGDVQEALDLLWNRSSDRFDLGLEHRPTPQFGIIW